MKTPQNMSHTHMLCGMSLGAALSAKRGGDGGVPFDGLFNDLFNDTPGTAIASHTPDFGTSWATAAYSEAAGGQIATNGSQLHYTSTSSSVYIAKIAPDPTSADVTLASNVKWVAQGGVAFQALTFFGARFTNQATRHGYSIEMFGTRFQIVRFINGSGVAIGNQWTPTWSAGDEVEVEFILSGTSLIVNVDGTQRLSATDGTHTTAGEIMAGGRLGTSNGVIDLLDFSVTEQ